MPNGSITEAIGEEPDLNHVESEGEPRLVAAAAKAETRFNLLSAVTATLSAHFPFFQTIAAWLVDHGWNLGDADHFIRGQFGGPGLTLDHAEDLMPTSSPTTRRQTGSTRRSTTIGWTRRTVRIWQVPSIESSPGCPQPTEPVSILSLMPQSSPITVSITRTVQPGQHRRFDAWVQAGQELAREWDGYLGSGWIRTTSDSDEWHVLYRFADKKSLRAWDESEDRRWWIDSAAELIETTRVEHRTGIEGWFEPRGEEAITIPETVVPPRWKQSVSIFLPFFPLSLLSTILLMPHLQSWPTVLAVLLNICILTPLMTYILLPMSTRLLRPWLQKPRH